jgi:hypothetical protein
LKEQMMERTDYPNGKPYPPVETAEELARQIACVDQLVARSSEAAYMLAQGDMERVMGAMIGIERERQRFIYSVPHELGESLRRLDEALNPIYQAIYQPA